MTALSCSRLYLKLQSKTMLKDVSFEVPKAALFAILGPNGAGKTLLLRCLAGLLVPCEGQIRMGAHSIAWVPLSQTLPFAFKVYELVLMGRYSRHHGFAQEADHEAVRSTLRRCGIEGFAERNYNSLSRGEQTKVDIARALASESELILMDEPFSNLDIDSALQMIALFQDLCRGGKTIILSHHDLYTVGDLASDALLIKAGQVLKCGSLPEVFQSAAIEKAYNVKAIFHDGPENRFVRFESLKR